MAVLLFYESGGLQIKRRKKLFLQYRVASFCETETENVTAGRYSLNGTER